MIERYTPREILKFGLSTQGLSKKHILLLAEALSKVPSDVLAETLDNIAFVSNTRTSGLAFNNERPFPSPQASIFLDKSLWNATKTLREEVILHELAHIFLKHINMVGSSNKNIKNVQEMFACSYQKKWLSDYKNDIKEARKLLRRKQ
mgnify:CR=1 FL=1